MSSDYTCEIYTLNAGRGDATLFIETENKKTFTTMIDCGPKRADSHDNGFKSFLTDKKIMTKTGNIKLTALILTHEDIDHVEFFMKYFLSKNTYKDGEDLFCNIENFIVSAGVLKGKHSKEFFAYLVKSKKYVRTKYLGKYRTFKIVLSNNKPIYHFIRTKQYIYASDPNAKQPLYDHSPANMNSLITFYTHPYLDTKKSQLFIFSADSLAAFVLQTKDSLYTTDIPCLFFKVPHHGSRMNNFDHEDSYNNKFDLKNVVFPLQAVSLCILCFRWKQMKGITLTDEYRRWNIRFIAGVPPSVHDIDIDYCALKVLPVFFSDDDKINQFLKKVLPYFQRIAKILSTANDLQSSQFNELDLALDALTDVIFPITGKDFVLLGESFFQRNSFLSSLWWRHLIARFYKKIDAKYYVISCYTSHGHPHMETITGIMLAAQQQINVERIILITNTSTSLEIRTELLQAEVNDFLDCKNNVFISNIRIIQSSDDNYDTQFDVNKSKFPTLNQSKKHTEYNYQSIQTSGHNIPFYFTKPITQVEIKFPKHQFFIGERPLNIKVDESDSMFPEDPFELCDEEDHKSYNIFQWNDQYDSLYTWFTIVLDTNDKPGCFVQAIRKSSKGTKKDGYYFFTQTYKILDLITSAVDNKIMEIMIGWYNDPKDISRRENKFLRVLDLNEICDGEFQLITTSLEKAKYPITWKKESLFAYTANYTAPNRNSSNTIDSYDTTISAPLVTTMMNSNDSSLMRYLQIINYDYIDNLEKTKLQQLLNVLLPSPLFLSELMERCKTNSSIVPMLSWQVDLSSSIATFVNESNNKKPCLINITLQLIVPYNSIYRFGSDLSQSQLIIQTTVNGIFPSSENLKTTVEVDFNIKTEGEQNYHDKYNLLGNEQSIITRPITFILNIDSLTDDQTITVMDVLACILSYSRAIRSTYYWPTFFISINLPNCTVDINQYSKFPSLVFFSLSQIQANSHADRLIQNPLGTKSTLNLPSDFIKDKPIPLIPNLSYFQPIIEHIELYTFQSTKTNLPASSVLLSDSNVWLKIIGKLEGTPVHIWMAANKEDDIEVLLPETIASHDCANLVAVLVAKQSGIPIADSITDWISTMTLPLLGDALKDFELSNVGFHIHRKLVEREDMEVNKLYFTIKHPLADYWTNKIIKLLPGSSSISIQQPQVSVDISYPLENSTNKSFISYTIDFGLKLASSSPLLIRFSKKTTDLDGSDVNEKRFELFVSTQINLTPVYSRRPDIVNGIVENFDYTTSFKSQEKIDSSPPTLGLIFNTFGLSSFIDILPCVRRLVDSTELELMKISCVYKNDTDNYTWDYLYFILRVSEFAFDSNIPLLKYFRFIDSEFDFECSPVDQWEFSLNTLVNIQTPDTDFFQCAISLSYKTNDISTGFSTFDFSIINEDKKFTLSRLLKMIGLDTINNIPIFNNLLHNLALIKFNCICSSNSKNSSFELEHLSITVNYTDRFTIGNLTFSNLSVTVDFDLKPRDSVNESKEYNISVNFTGTLNCLSVSMTYNSTTRILSGSAQAIASKVGLKQTLECFVTPNKDQSLENDAVLSSIIDYEQFGLNFLEFEIQLETLNDSNIIQSCFLKSASIDLSGSLSISIFQLTLKSLKVEYEKMNTNTDSSISSDIYSSSRINLIATLSQSQSESRAEIHIECNKKKTTQQSVTIVQGKILPLTYDSLTFQSFLNLFSWTMPNSSDEISLLKTIQIKSASIELTIETNQPWRITSAQCTVEAFRDILIHEQNPNIILKLVSLCVEYKEKRDLKVFFYLNGQMKLGGVSVSASYHLTEKQILTAIIESDIAQKIQLSKLTEQYVDNKEINDTDTNIIRLPDAPTGLIPLKIASKSYAFAHLNLTDLKYTFYGQYEQMASGILYINKDTPSSSINSYVFVVRTGDEFKFEKLFDSGSLQSLAKTIDKILTIEAAIIYINSFPTKTIQLINEDIDNAVKDFEYDAKNNPSTSVQSSIVSPFVFNGSKISFTSLEKDFGAGCFVYVRLNMDTTTSSSALKNLIAICSTRDPIEMIGFFPKKSTDEDDQAIEFIGRHFALVLLGKLQISVQEMKYVARQSKIDREKPNDKLILFSLDGSLSVIWDLSLLQDKQKMSEIKGMKFNLKIYDNKATFSVDLSNIISPFGLSNIEMNDCRFSGTYEFETDKKFKTSNYSLEGTVILRSATNRILDISLITKLFFHPSSLMPVAVCIDLKDKKVNLLQLLIKLLTLNAIDNADFLDISVVDKIYGCCIDTFSSPDDKELVLSKGARFTIDFFEIFRVLVDIISVGNTYEIIGTATKPFDLIILKLKHHKNTGKDGQGPTVKYSSAENNLSIYFSIGIGEYTLSDIEIRYVFNENKFIARVLLLDSDISALDISWSKSTGVQWTLAESEKLKTLITTAKFTEYLMDMLNSMETDLCGAITNLILEDSIKGTMSASFQFNKSSADENATPKVLLILDCTLEIHLAGSSGPTIMVPISKIEITITIPMQDLGNVKDILSFTEWLFRLITSNMKEFFIKFAKNSVEVFKIIGILTASKFTRDLLTKLACRIPKNTLLKDIENLVNQAVKELELASIGMDTAFAAATDALLVEAGSVLVYATAAAVATMTVLSLFGSLWNLFSDETKEKKNDAEKKLQDNFNNVRDKVLTLHDSQKFKGNKYPFIAVKQRSDKIKNDRVNGYDEIQVYWEALSSVNNYSFTYFIMLTIPNDKNSSIPFRYFKETSENTVVFTEPEILTASHCEVLVQARCKIVTEKHGKIIELLFRGPGIIWNYQSDYHKFDKPEDEKTINPFSIDKYPNLPSPQPKSCTYTNGKIHLEFKKIDRTVAYEINALQNNQVVFSTITSQIADHSNIISWSESICNIPGNGDGLYTFSVRAISPANSKSYDSLSVKFSEQFQRQNSPQNIQLEYEQISNKLIIKWMSLENVSYVIQSVNSSNIIHVEKSFHLLNPDSHGFGFTSFDFNEIFPNFNGTSQLPWSLYIYTEGSSVIMNSSKILLKDKIAYADVSPLVNIQLEADNIKQQLNISFDHPINSNEVKYKYTLMNISNSNEQHIEIENEISLNKAFQWLYSSFQSSVITNQSNKYQVIINILIPSNNLEFLLKSNQSRIEGKSNELIQLPKVTQCTANYDNIEHMIRLNFICPIAISDPIAKKIGYNIKWSKSNFILFVPFTLSASNFEIISIESRTDKIRHKFDENTKCLSVELYFDPNKIKFLGSELSIQGLVVIDTVTIENMHPNINYMNSWSVNSPILDISLQLATPQNLTMTYENKNPLLNQLRIQCDEVSHVNQYHFSIDSSMNNTNSSQLINIFNKISNQPWIVVSLYELLKPFISSFHYYSASVFVSNTDIHVEKSSIVSIPMTQWIPSLASPTQAMITYLDDDSQIILQFTSVSQDNLMVDKFDCYCMDLVSTLEEKVIVHGSLRLKPILQDNNPMNLSQKIDIRVELGIKLDSRKEYLLYLRANSKDSAVISSLPFLIPESKIKFLSAPDIYSLHPNNGPMNFDITALSYPSLEIYFNYDKEIKYLLIKLIQYDKILISSKLYPRTIDSTDNSTKSVVEFTLADLSMKDRSKTEDRQFIIVAYGSNLLSLPSSPIAISSLLQLPAPDRLSLVQDENDGINLKVTITARIPLFSGQLPLGSHLQLALVWFSDESTDLSNAIACKSLENILIDKNVVDADNQMHYQYTLSKEDLAKFTTKETVMGVKARLRISDLNFFFNSYETISTDLIKFIPLAS